MIVDGKIYYTEQEIQTRVEKLADLIKSSKKKIDLIVGIESSGLYISRPLAQLLNLPHASVKISFYGESKTPKDIPVVKSNIKWSDTDTYLFVDDLIDSGSTIHYLPKLVKKENFLSAVLFLKKNNKYEVTPDFWVEEKPEGWLNFYWE